MKLNVNDTAHFYFIVIMVTTSNIMVDPISRYGVKRQRVVAIALLTLHLMLTMTDVDISCTLSDQPNHLLFSYPIIYKALDESINANFQLSHHQYVSHTIMSFLSSKNIHLIPSRNVNVDTEWLDGPNASVVTLLAVSVHDNQPLFRISSTLKDLPKSWTDPTEREDFSGGCGSASYALHVTGNHLWIEYEEGDECFSDEEAWNNEDPSVYYEMRTHHLFHSTIVPAHNAPTRLTRVSHRRKMECPLKINKWDIYSGKRELVKWDDGPSDGYSLIKNTDLRNYQSELFFVEGHCLLFAAEQVYILNQHHAPAQFDILTKWNHPYINRIRCASITNFFKAFKVLDVAFLLDNVSHFELNKDDSIICILNNVKDFRINLIRISAKESDEEPPKKKRKIDHENESLLFSMDLNGLLSRLYDAKALFIHGYYVDVQNECVMIVVNTSHVLCIDKDCNLIKRHVLNDNVFDKGYFGQWWTPNDYVVKIESALNNRDFLFVIQSASHSGKHDVVLVDGYDFSRVGNGKFESHLRWGRGLSEFGTNSQNRTPCNLSNMSDLFPFIY
eukprot:448096_1